MNNQRKDILKRGIDVTLYPLPFRKGGKITNGNAPKPMQNNAFGGGGIMNKRLGDKTIKPGIEYADGGKPKPTTVGIPPKPGVGDFLKAAFSSSARDEYRFARKANKAVEGKGSQSFTTASDFKLPSGQMARKGSPVYITPQTRNVMTNPGQPGTPGMPAVRKKVQVGEKTNFTPKFTETGAYGAPAPGAPTTGNYESFPANMNPGLRQALVQAISNQQPVAMWNGKPFMAGEVTKEPIFEDQVTPATPGTPTIPPTFQEQTSIHTRTGGFGGSNKSFGKRETPTVSWLSQHRSKREKGH